MKSNHTKEPIEIRADAHICIIHTILFKQSAMDKRRLVLHTTIVQVHETRVFNASRDDDSLTIAVNDDFVAVEDIGSRG